jgi:general secretion pathway protein L
MDLLRNFLDWWLRQVAALLPLGAVQLGFNASHAAVLEIIGDEGTLLLRRRGQLTPVGRGNITDPQELRTLVGRLPRSGGAPPQTVLRLSGGAILRKHLSVPAGARWHMEKVLAFEFDRETPFAADEAYWAYAIRHHNRARNLLDVELVIITRSEIDPLVAAMRRAGAEVIGVEISSPPEEPLLVRLQEGKRHSGRLASRSFFVRAGVAIGLTAIAIIVPFARLHFARTAAERSIAAMTGTAEEAGSLRKAVDQFSDVAAYLTQERQRSGPALAVLASITNDLPDDTHLAVLSLHSGHVTIQGLALSTAQVVALISKDPMFTDQGFDSPVVQDSKSGLENFTLSFALKSASTP